MSCEPLSVPFALVRPGGAPCDGKPVTGGVPLPEGALPPATELGLQADDGRPLPLQWEITERWEDGSARWVLLDFRATDSRSYRLTKAAAQTPEPRARVFRRGDAVTIDTGPLRLRLNAARFRLFDSVAVEGRETAGPGELALVDSRRHYAAHAEPASCVVERRGPNRVTVAVRGHYTTARGVRGMAFVVRIHAYAGSCDVKVEHILVNDSEAGVWANVRALRLSLLVNGGVREAAVGRARARNGGHIVARQHDHETVVRTLNGNEERESGRLEGWATARGAEGAAAVALREAWQQWPCELAVSESGIAVGLLPDLATDAYDGREPLAKHFYLFDGPNYRIKTGVAKRHECVFRFSAGADVDGADLAAQADAPVYVSADPAYAVGTGAWGDLAAAGEGTAYDDWLAATHRNDFLRAQEDDAQTGVLNWGDWFGERRYNWGNNEYDPAHAAWLDFARTGDAAAALLAERSARHMADVDILHAVNADYLASPELAAHNTDIPLGVGAMYLHAIGHVGGYFPLKWARKRFPKAYPAADPRNLGHVWTEGMVELARVTGDAWARESAVKHADFLVQVANTPGQTFWFGRDPHCGRTAGWSLTALLAVYAMTGKKTYLRAARHIVELALADQDPHCGGWIYPLYPGHCFCRRGHVGMATFITSVLLNGLVSYHLLTGDQRVAAAIVRAADFIISDTWVEHVAGFRYTSCPASRISFEPLVYRPLAYACQLDPDERRLSVLDRAWEQFLTELRSMHAVGKAYGRLHRESPRVLAQVGRLAQAGE